MSIKEMHQEVLNKRWPVADVESLLEQFHSMTIEFLHAGKDPVYEDICAAIGFVPIYNESELNGLENQSPEC